MASNVVPAVRTRLQMAEEQLAIACKLLRENGLPENADELVKDLSRIRVWTQKDGWLDWIEKPGGTPCP